MLETKAPKKYKKYTLILLIVTAAALVVYAASLSLKRDVLAVQADPEQNLTSYYSPNPVSSQETGNGGENSQPERAASAAAPVKRTSPAPSKPAEKESYLVTVHEGKIGVFRNKEASPFLTADIDVYLLPKEDLVLLKKGIRAESFAEVKGILEDYE